MGRKGFAPTGDRRLSRRTELMTRNRRFRFDGGLTGTVRQTVAGLVETMSRLYVRGCGLTPHRSILEPVVMLGQPRVECARFEKYLARRWRQPPAGTKRKRVKEKKDNGLLEPLPYQPHQTTS
jgi:hypothetical protein